MINGTAANDTILIGADDADNTRALVRFNGVNIPVIMRSSTGNLLVEQFRVAGLVGNDTIGGLGTNHLYAWSFDPTLGGQFAVFVDS